MDWFVLVFIVCLVVFCVSAVTGGTLWHRAKAMWFEGYKVGPGDMYIVNGRTHKVPEVPLQGGLTNKRDLLAKDVLETAQVQLMQVLHTLEEQGVEVVCYGPTLHAVCLHETLVSPWSVDMQLAIADECEPMLTSDKVVEQLLQHGLTLQKQKGGHYNIQGGHDITMVVLKDEGGRLGPHPWDDVMPTRTKSVQGLFVPCPAKPSAVLQQLGLSLKDLHA